VASSISFTVPAGITSATIFHLIAVNGTLAIDNASLVPTGVTPPPPTPTLTASASANPVSGTVPLAVNFTGSATGGSGTYTYAWTFGDGGAASTQNPSHTYNATGTMVAKLTVNDGSTSTSSNVTVSVSDPISTPPPAPGSNMIANGDFELGTAGNPTGWGKGSWGSLTPTFTYPVAGVSGNAAQLTIANYQNGDAKWYFTPVNVTAGASYDYTDLYKATAPSQLVVQYQNASGVFSYAWLKDLPAATDWVSTTATFTVPTGVVAVTIFHLIAVNGTLAIDNASMVTTPPPTPIPGAHGMVSITFDDGWLSQYTAAEPILAAHNMPATFYITTEQLQYSDFMNDADVLDLAQRGYEIGDHTVTHPHLPQLSDADLQHELVDSKTYLENLIGTPVDSLAYPYGEYDARVISAAQSAGYTNARTVDGTGLNDATTNIYLLDSYSPTLTTPMRELTDAVDQAKATGGWMIVAFHMIDNGGDQYSNTPAYFQSFVQYLADSGIDVVTVDQALAHLQP
jgi:peptidoglycan/xylan/chitin deacetylase (PgdA/CDA1 family)